MERGRAVPVIPSVSALSVSAAPSLLPTAVFAAFYRAWCWTYLRWADLLRLNENAPK